MPPTCLEGKPGLERKSEPSNIMAAMEHFSKANQAFVDENYEEAVAGYTAAISEDESQPDFYANRANAYLKLNKNDEALKDTNQALTLDPKHLKAMERKGIALFNLENFADAKKSFEEGKAAGGAGDNIDRWIRKCEAELNLKDAADGTKVGSSQAPAELPMPTGPKTRYDWYQTESMVVVTIMLKGVKKEDLTCNIEEQSMSVCVKLPTGSDYTLDLDLLYPIVKDKSNIKILSTKVEIKLPKTEGIRWEKLERDHTAEPVTTKPKHFIPADHAATGAGAAAAAVVNKYPSSSHKTKDWDKLVSEIKEEEKEEKPEGEAALNTLFQQIYKDGNDETRKAMNKSFVESGGTVLSTNWKDIAEKKTEIKPPDGMEYKKWQ